MGGAGDFEFVLQKKHLTKQINCLVYQLDQTSLRGLSLKKTIQKPMKILKCEQNSAGV